MADKLGNTHFRLVGITGGIGCGKSVVSRICRLKGYSVYDCDSKAKMLMDSDSRLRATLVDILGSEILRDGGSINRGVMASIIFSDVEKRRAVNECVHGAVRMDLSNWCVSQGANLLFVESAILVTSHLVDDVDSIWQVVAPEQPCVERVIHRNGIGREEVMARMDSQRREFDLLSSGKSHQIVNDGREPLLPRIDELLFFENSFL